MTTIKKTLLLAVTAIAAMAFAGPAVSSAATWTVPALDEAVETGFDGSLKFDIGDGTATITCDTQASVTLQPSSSGSVDELTFDSCEGGGVMEEEECTVEVTAETLPGLTAKGGLIELDPFNVTASPELCGPVPTFYFTVEDLTLSPDDARSISTLTASGEASNESEIDIDLSGALDATQPDTYGIGVGDKWIDVKNPAALESPANIDVSGTMGWSYWGAGMTCDVDGELTLQPGDEAELDSFKAIPGTCEGHGFQFEGCQLTFFDFWNEGTAQLTEAGQLEFTGPLGYTADFSGCPEENMEAESLRAVPDDPRSISGFTIEESVTLDIGAGPGEFPLTIDLDVAPAGKYGIG